MPLECRWEAAAASSKTGEEVLDTLAQDVEAALPAYAYASLSRHKSIAYEMLTVVFTGAVQALTKQNAALEPRAADLESELR